MARAELSWPATASLATGCRCASTLFRYCFSSKTCLSWVSLATTRARANIPMAITISRPMTMLKTLKKWVSCLLTFGSAWNACKSAAQYRPACEIAPCPHETRRRGAPGGGEVHHLRPSGLCDNGPTRLQSSLLDAQDARPACTVGAGACTQQTPEAAVECGQVAESCFERNGADRVAGAPQAHGGALQPRVQQKLMRRHSCNGAEGSQEMIGTHRDIGCELLQR